MSDDIGAPPELKPCPFCGNDLVIRWRKINPKASCQTAGCWGAKLPVLHLDIPEVVAAWNTRAALKDAERYRLLKRGQHWSTVNGIGDTLRGEDLDRAIDAVMQPAKGDD